MKTTNSFSITFFLKKDKTSKGYAPLYVRITVNDQYVDLSVKRKVKVANWNQTLQRVTGGAEEGIEVGEKIRQMRNEINSAYDDLRLSKQLVDAQAIKARVEGIDEDNVTLCFLMNYHNTEIKRLLEPGTMKNYYTTERYIKEFLTKKKRRADIYLSQLDYKFILDFEIYLRHRTPDKKQRHCSNNTVMKHLERLHKMIGIAHKNEWIVKDPFIRFERSIVFKERECLEAEELENIKNLKLQKENQQIVRDIFVFSCYTGLAYADVSLLNNNHLVTDIEGEKWIEMVRKKTANFNGKKFFVMLLPEALDIIKKYKCHPQALHSGTLMPVFTNQAINRHLKVIGKLACLDKELTFHMARHTFATTVTLENGVPIESVSKMLGHTKISTTQIYSRVKKKKVGADMKELRQRISSNVSE